VTDVWGITDGYHDTDGGWHPTSDATRAVLRAAMGSPQLEAPPPPPPMWFVVAGSAPGLQGPCDLRLEDGSVLEGLHQLPPDLPIGYHDLLPLDGYPSTRLVVTPRRCRVPDRMWGWATMLFALRSAGSWGMGDLADLRELARWSASLGAGAIMVNPLHAISPHPQVDPSPYFASSRLWRNVLYLRVAELPGAGTLGEELVRLDEAGRALSSSDRIDRAAVFELKLAALRALFDTVEASGQGEPAFDEWRAAQGSDLRTFATFSALAEDHGPNWMLWPAAYQHPDAAEVRAFAAANERRLRFHEWCQWHLDCQLAEAGGSGVALVSDLAVGFDASGADGWAYQDLLATGCRVGAPPDTFNTAGQDWGLPPFVPWKLRTVGYDPIRATIRSAFGHCGGIRIDHVMGLFRLYWVPPDGGPADGAYVRYAASDLLDIVAVEAHRAGGFVVGEDLGTVEDEVRHDLADRGILSYRLLLFEDDPRAVTAQALASVTTHDLPTTVGAASGKDLADRQRLGLPGAEAGDGGLGEHVRRLAGPGAGTPEEVVVALHEQLAATPSLVLLATLDDAVANPDRPNMPGTTDEWPNWRLPLPVSLEQLEEHPLAHRVAEVLRRAVHPEEA
jgi:4-alpha-glucanotransferase